MEQVQKLRFSDIDLMKPHDQRMADFNEAMVDHIRRLRNASSIHLHRPQNQPQGDIPLAFQKVQQLQLESTSLGE